MEKKDLMIGDWVLLTDGPARVISIAQDGIYFEDKFGEGICSFDKIQPIPLTAEILEKNGFVYNAIPFVDGWEQFGLTLYRGGNGYRIDCGINVSLIIDYIHQIQNALRLCGIEKEIEL